jgi:hypothetical protein
MVRQRRREAVWGGTAERAGAQIVALSEPAQCEPQCALLRKWMVFRALHMIAGFLIVAL